MRFDAFYVIRGRAVLRDRLASSAGEAVAELLGDPQLWQHGEGGRTAWTDEDHIATVKILYLLHVLENYGSSPEIGETIRDLVGPPPLTIAAFDAWWELERYAGVDENADDVLRSIPAAKFALVQPTGLPLVDQWLKDRQASS